MRVPFFFVAVLAALAAFGAQALAGNTGIVRGYVVDRVTGERVAYARVIARSPAVLETTQSDAHRFFVFMSLPPGDVAISAVKAGYVPYTVRAVCVETDLVKEVTISTWSRGSAETRTTYPRWKC